RFWFAVCDADRTGSDDRYSGRRNDRETAQGADGRGWRRHDRDSHVRLPLAVVRSPRRRRVGRRQVCRVRQAISREHCGTDVLIMARALTIQRAMVPATERAKYFARLEGRRAHYQRADCRFWVFEEIGLPGLFIEFTEAHDAATLTAAH